MDKDKERETEKQRKSETEKQRNKETEKETILQPNYILFLLLIF